jgi:L-ascorbate metabolism protein UlaG (beta-lactamase superfamily)
MKLFIVVLLTFSLNIPTVCQEQKIIDQIKNPHSGTAVWWIGQNSWIIKSGEYVIATDLYLGGERINRIPVTSDELAEVIDFYFVTHDHGDHFGRETARVLAKNSACRFILPESCMETAQNLNIPDDRITIARPREPFEMDGIKVQPLRALHGRENFAVHYDANFQDCGYLITINGIKILQPGDSHLLQDHLLLKEVDVLFFSRTEHNMHINPSLVLINELNPDYIIPQHHSTMVVNDNNRFWTKGYPDEVKILLSQQMKKKYHILKPGDKMIIE